MVGAPLAVEQVVVGEAVIWSSPPRPEIVLPSALPRIVSSERGADRVLDVERAVGLGVGPSLKLELSLSETLTAAFEEL